MVCELWAEGVEWELTRMVYIDYEGDEPVGDYTKVVIDLIDSPTYKSEIIFGIKTKVRGRDTPLNSGFDDENDLVEGYTIKQIENTLLPRQLIHIGLWWHDWHDNIYDYNYNPSRIYVRDLFHNSDN